MKRWILGAAEITIFALSTYVWAGDPCPPGSPNPRGIVRGDHGRLHQTLMGAWAQRRAQTISWHDYYYDPAWGMPVAVVVPPRAKAQTQWGWGVGNTRVIGIPHQFQPGYPAPGIFDRSLFQPTPPWPNDTTQFGYYYIRGPW
ncbi:MAG: hypothetical protein NZ602_12745 [Thermoguttaceae bacterium]|nr:hypothetical protein [Thermoguttaceae bacterium]MDW8038821.1 hypothetical protein [Thermoguttaceae bacterium]